MRLVVVCLAVMLAAFLLLVGIYAIALANHYDPIATPRGVSVYCAVLVALALLRAAWLDRHARN